MYLSAVGFGMVFGGIIVKLGDLEANKIDRSYELTFAGGFITTLCWVWQIFCNLLLLCVCIVKLLRCMHD